MTIRTTRAPGEVGRIRTAGFVRALAPGWFWSCRLCPSHMPPAYGEQHTREAATTRLAAHQLTDHLAWVLAALAHRAAQKEAA